MITRRAALLFAVLLALPGLPAHSQIAGGAVGTNLLVADAVLPPAGTLRFAAAVSPVHARNYFPVTGGRAGIPDSLGGSMTAASFGLQALFTAAPGWTVGASWMPGVAALSSFSADENRRALSFAPVHLAVARQITGGINPLFAGSVAGSAPPPGGGPGSPLTTTAALIVAVPIPWPDYEIQLDRLNQGGTYVAENSGVRAWAVGYQLAAHWIPGAPPAAAFEYRPASPWSLHATHDLLIFLPAPYESAGVTEYEQNQIWKTIPDIEPFDTINYRFQVGVEVEPRLHLTALTGSMWRVGVPVAWRYRPAPVFDGELAVRDTQEWSVHAGITAAVTPFGMRRHLEFIFDYRAPVAGKNLRAEHRLGVGLAVDFISRRTP